MVPPHYPSSSPFLHACSGSVRSVLSLSAVILSDSEDESSGIGGSTQDKSGKRGGGGGVHGNEELQRKREEVMRLERLRQEMDRLQVCASLQH